MIVPESALTTDEYDYIGYLVNPTTYFPILHEQPADNPPELHNPRRRRFSMVWSLTRAERADDTVPPTDDLAL